MINLIGFSCCLFPAGVKPQGHVVHLQLPSIFGDRCLELGMSKSKRFSNSCYLSLQVRIGTLILSPFTLSRSLDIAYRRALNPSMHECQIEIVSVAKRQTSLACGGQSAGKVLAWKEGVASRQP